MDQVEWDVVFVQHHTYIVIGIWRSPIRELVFV